MEIRPKWTKEELDAIFSKATPIVAGTTTFRKDCYGNMISRTAYGLTNNPFGWEVDHIKPIAKGGSNELKNLQPLCIKANRSKSDDTL